MTHNIYLLKHWSVSKVT